MINCTGDDLLAREALNTPNTAKIVMVWIGHLRTC